MAEATVTVRYVGDAASLIRAQKEAADSAGTSSAEMKAASEDANTNISGAFSKMSKKVLGSVDNMFGTNFSKAADAAGKKMDDVGSHSTGLFNKLSSIGAGATVGMGVAVVAIGGMAVDLGEKYQGLTTNIAAWGGISVTAAKKITDSFLNTAGTTIYSASDIAKSYGSVVGQLTAVEGHTLNSAQAMTVMHAAMDLAEGSGESLGTATTALAGVMQTYKMNTSEAAKASDQLFSIAKGSGTSLGAVAQSVKQVHTQLGAMTPPLGQTGALLVDMVEHGMNGSRALRSLGTSMNALLKPSENLLNAQNQSQVALKALPPSLQALGAQYIAGTTTAAQVTAATSTLDRTQTTLWGNLTKATGAIDTSNLKISQMGFSAFNAQGKFIGLKQVFTDLYDQIQHESPKAQLATLAQDGLASSAAKLLPVIAAGPAAFDKAAESVMKAGAAHAAAAKQAQTLSHEFEMMKTTVEDLVTKLGVVLIPAITSVMGVFSKATNFVMNHKAVLLALAVLIGGFLTVTIGAFAINTMGKLVDSIGKAGGSVTDFVGKLTGMGASVEPPATEMETAALDIQEAMQAAAGIIDEATLTINTAWESIGTMSTESASEMDLAVISMQESMLGINTSSSTTEADVQLSFEGMGTSAEAAATAVEVAAARIEAADAAMAESTTVAAATMDTADAAMGAGAEGAGAAAGAGAGAAGAGAGAAAGEDAAAAGAGVAAAGAEVDAGAAAAVPGLGQFAIAAGVVVVGAMELSKVFDKSSKAAQALSGSLTAGEAAWNLPQSTLPQVNAKLKDLEKTYSDLKSKQESGQGGPLGSVQSQALQKLPGEIDKVRDKYTALTNTASGNAQVLSAATGLPIKSVKSLASAFGIDLTKSLNPAAIEQYTNYLKANGGAAGVVAELTKQAADKTAAALQIMVGKAAVAMPGISKAAQTMVATTQPHLVDLVAKMKKAGDDTGASWVSAFLGHMSPALMASKNMHNAIMSPLLPLEKELRQNGDKAAANAIAGFIGHQGEARTAAKAIADGLKDPMKGLASGILPLSDKAGQAVVDGFLKHNAGATNAALEVRGSMGSALTPLIGELQSVGDASGAATIAGLQKHDEDAADAAKFMHDIIKKPLDGLKMELGANGQQAAEQLVQNFQNHHGDAQNASDIMHDAMTGKFKTMAADLGGISDKAGAFTVSQFSAHESDAQSSGNKVGGAFGTGMTAGIAGSQGVVDAAMAALVNKGIAAAKAAGVIMSPSKRAAVELGLPLAQGIAQGITSGQRTVTASMLDLMEMDKYGVASNGLFSAASLASNRAQAPSASGGGGPITVVLQIDGQRFAQAILNPLQTAALRGQKTGGQFTISLI